MPQEMLVNVLIHLIVGETHAAVCVVNNYKLSEGNVLQLCNQHVKLAHRVFKAGGVIGLLCIHWIGYHMGFSPRHNRLLNTKDTNKRMKQLLKCSCFFFHIHIHNWQYTAGNM